MPLYRRSPPGLQNVIGTVYGSYLNFWRYGPAAERLVQEALARERWSADKWRAWQAERLRSQLRHAAEHVPYYREQWRARREAGDQSSVEQIENWPVLRKEALRADPSAFLAEDRRGRALFRQDTSGTSGTPITTWRSRATMRAWYALVEARWRRWYGVSRHAPWALLGGQEVTPVERETPPFWLWNKAGNQLYMSTLHLNASTAPAYLDALRAHRVEHIYAYSSSIAELARLALDGQLKVPDIKVVVTNAEPLEPHQREAVARAFGCPVHASYGMSEAVAGASECEHGRLHLWPEAGYLEVLEDDHDRLVRRGETGRLVSTGLLNFDMPLIRYEIGDRGALGKALGDAACDCGRSLPTLARVEGRMADNLVAVDGSKVFWLNPVLYGQPIREAQIVQESRDLVIVKVVPDEGFSSASVAAISQGLKRRLGDLRVEVHRVERIERGPNGKFRPVVNRLGPSERTAALVAESRGG